MPVTDWINQWSGFFLRPSPSLVGVFDDSPNQDLGKFQTDQTQQYLESYSEKVEWKHLPSSEFQANRYNHTAEVVINLKTANLLEGARNYLW